MPDVPIDPAPTAVSGADNPETAKELRHYSDGTGRLTVVGVEPGDKSLRLEPQSGTQPWVLNATTHRPLRYIDTIVEHVQVQPAINEIYRETIVAKKLKSLLDLFPQIESNRIKSILEIGCGAGASTNVICDLFPEASILGVDIDEKSIHAAQRRSAILGQSNTRFLTSEDSASLPESVEQVDLVLMNAVFEHLLPEERRQLMPKVWECVRPGGLLVLIETPHRWFPVEVHTTSLPLLNYLPDGLALSAVRRFCRVFDQNVTWPTLLRAGTRGGTVREIVACAAGESGPEPEIMHSPTFGKRAQVELWWHGDARHSPMKHRVFSALRLLRRTTGIDWTPWITLVLRKPL